MAILDDLSGKLNELSSKLKDGDLSSRISELGNNVADALNMGARTAYGRAKNAAEVGSLKLKLADAKKAEAEAFEKFGRRYMELHKDDADPALKEELASVRFALDKVTELKSAIEQSRAAMEAAEADMKEKARAAGEAQKAAKHMEDEGDDFSEEEIDDVKAEETAQAQKAPEKPEEAASAEAGEEASAEADEALQEPEEKPEDKPEE